MALPHRARSVVDVLASAHPHDVSTIYICHSLGGLLIKQILRLYDYSQHHWRHLIDCTKGVVFLGTPHTGSSLANLASALRLVGFSKAAKQLAADDPHLLDLDVWFREYATREKLSIAAFYEMMPVRGVVKVVSESSGDPRIPGCIPVPVDADHFRICKPDNRQAAVYSSVKRFIGDCLGNADPGDFIIAKRHRQLFDRPAFRRSCISETSLLELADATDATVSALNTGMSYSRRGELLAKMPSKQAYRNPHFTEALDAVVDSLGDLKQAVGSFETWFMNLIFPDRPIPSPEYRPYRDFNEVLSALVKRANKMEIRHAVASMDRIDMIRNDILTKVNGILAATNQKPFHLIGLSSSCISETWVPDEVRKAVGKGLGV
jgi:hypothetical protein